MEEYTNISYRRVIHIFFHEPTVCKRDTKWKKAYLTSVGNIVMWFYRSLTGSETTSTAQRKEAKEKKKKKP